jgi:hypothetical protein
MLAGDVQLAHIYRAAEAESGGHSGGRHPMLTGAGLRYDAAFAHPFYQQPLLYHIVDLVSPGVIEVLPFDIDSRTAKMLCQIFGKCQGCRPA